MKIRSLCLLIALLSFAVNTFGQNSDIFKRQTIESKMMSVTRWQLANPKHELYDWTNGAFYAGVFAAYETTKSPEDHDRSDCDGRKKWLETWSAFRPCRRYRYQSDVSRFV
ncbi:MAG: hypothetical protein QM785_10965 [Pyrinomonadaceae bacterium]